jgi:hypothetical protein
MASFPQRIIGAARLDPATYNEVEEDQSATSQAMLIVVLSSVAAGIGGGSEGAGLLIAGVFAALVGWAALAGVIFFVGTRFLAEPQTRADWGQLLRTLGFATTPQLIRVFGVIDFLGVILGWIALIWMLAAMVVAVREALDYKDTGRAVAACLIGFVVYLAVGTLVAMLLGVFMVGAAGVPGASG